MAAAPEIASQYQLLCTLQEAKGDFELHKASIFTCRGVLLSSRAPKVQFIICLTTFPQLAQKRHRSECPLSAYYESKAFNGEM